MKPFDARLLRYARGVLPLLGWGTLLGVVRACAILTWAWSIAHLIAWYARPIMRFDWAVTSIGQVFDGLEDRRALWLSLAIAALIVRTVAVWLMNRIAERGAAIVKMQLRSRALEHIGELGPAWIAGESEAAVTLKLSRGLDALDKYFSEYLPQLFLTATVTPLLVAALFVADPLSAIIVVIVFPIIPVFMVLIGLATSGAQEKQWAALGRLSKAYLDVVRGLPTLKLFRREARQVQRIEEITDEYRSRTMKVLRVTFLSGFVLDLAGTFSVALVAVTVGTRLVAGAFPLALALFVLLLVPEVFVPIRQVGAAFHASTEGLAAAEDIFTILETSPEPVSSPRVNRSQDRLLTAKNVQATRGGAPVSQPVSVTVKSGHIVALAGPSGVGKSAFLTALLGIGPYTGTVEIDAYAWSGQRAGLLRGSVAENVALGCDEPNMMLVRRALREACLEDLDASQQLGTSGEGLSGGQAQRVALARAIYRMRSTGAPLLLLDEPTSALDRATEQCVIAALRRLTTEGHGVLVVSHREQVLDAADEVVYVSGRVPA